jgi:PAS domain S-box-containing protein
VRISVVRDLDERRNMQEKVKESEARFTAVFQNASLGIALTDRNGKFVEANYTLLQRLGYTLDEIKGLDIYHFLEADDHSSTKNYFKQLLSGKTSTAFFERRWQRKNGSSTWSKMTCNVLQGTQGKTLILSIIEDIDLQKRNEQALMESEEKFRAVYESSPMGIVITSDGGRIHDVNDAFVNMLGYTEAALHSKNILDFTHPADKDAAQVQLVNIYSGAAKHYSVEKRFLRKDGTEFWAREAMSSLFHVGDAMYTVAIIENIEGRKRAEAALEQKNLELTHTNQELEHFAYVASHDLQEPLRTITSFIQILERRYHDKLDIEAQQFMGFIVDGAKRMQTLIHDLLEYSRINRYNTGFEKIDLNEIFITVNHVLKDKIETHEALIMAEHLPEVYGNRIQLTQVFQNLIDNAIKFKSDKRTPEVTISVIEHKTTWELIFKDNGIGISAEYFQRIFVIFQRLHTVEEYTGTGIGLAICRKIIERHGGEIWVESKPGKGSTFHLTLSKKLSAG